MRFLISSAAILLLGACQVSKDDANDSVSVTYNSDVAENTAADIGNTAENIATDIGDDVKATGEKIDQRVDVNADVKVDTNSQDNQ